jgi:GTP-binding protein SAR1
LDYFATVDAVVFLVDAVERSRLPEATNELQAILATDELSHVPILVLGNKVDLPTACPRDEQD